MLVDKQSELMSDLLFNLHQHGGDDVTWKPPIVRILSSFVCSANYPITAHRMAIVLGTFRACLHGGGGPQVGEVTRLGEVKK